MAIQSVHLFSVLNVPTPTVSLLGLDNTGAGGVILDAAFVTFGPRYAYPFVKRIVERLLFIRIVSFND